ncbi:KdsC family phosphatase [Magnetofaba australis]|uniref:3-deoxy-D-manno-octulosonate 8-phosphate phosphatase KdsC n=1 Tax=Magnetofaba australis IT-1 TaxID=1434232 RepID=A0A1Y2K1T7_9PROT|nr:hypothetical protein [Magnetofaba australis]OSM01627.1 putative 3-deoxy-D-manno-octulosonate 8-phosphate phosphatase [Magnetofaba australis IT-1]
MIPNAGEENTLWTPQLAERAAKIRLLALDVDGVLTDGGIYLDNAGGEMKRFNVQDGLGARLLLDAGVAVGVITARKSDLVARRARELKLAFAHQGAHEKWACLEQEMATRGLTADQCAFMGDDLVDLGVMSRVGLAACPANAHEETRRRSHWQASAAGGEGAVRELADHILRAQGRWDEIVAAMVAGTYGHAAQ